MPRKSKRMVVTSSIEDASILRKFTLLFFMSSIIPMSFVYYIFLNYKKLDLSDAAFSLAMTFMVIGVGTGFYYMRTLLVKIVTLTKENRSAIERFLSPEAMEELNQGENEIVVLSRSFSVVTKQLEENIQSLENAKKTLQSVMTKVGHGISNMEKIDTFVELIVETMANALNVKVSTLMLLDEDKTDLIVHTVYGSSATNPENPIRIKLLPGSPFTKVVEEKRPQIISGVIFKNMNNENLNSLFSETLLCVPLVYKDHVSGIITLNKTDSGDFSEDDINLTFHLACQTAVALENSKLNNDIEKTYFETISALALAVDAKDKYSRGHLDRVADYVTMIGKHLGLDENDLHSLSDAARLHDLGKIGIPDEILKKEGELTDEEWVIMKRHTEIGESIIKPVRSLQHLCDPIRHHHEKLDGTGYPDRLKGDEISAFTRILAVADIYDALTTERPYRGKKSVHEAAQIMRSMKNHLDQDIVEAFFESLEKSGKFN